MRKSRGVTTYSGAHANTQLHRGPAKNYTCVCGEPAVQWAYKHGSPREQLDPRGLAFSIEPMDYEPMCLRCHRVYDKAHITHCPNGHPYEGDNLIFDAGKRKCRTCVYARNADRRLANPMTPEQKARKADQQRARAAAAKALANRSTDVQAN